MECINKRCKKQLPEGAKFCPWCGKSQSKHRTRRSNGEGCVYQLPNGKWRVDITIQHRLVGEDNQIVRDRATGTFSTKTDALAAIPELRAAKLQQIAEAAAPTQRTISGMTVEKAWEIYLDSKAWRKLSASQQGKLALARRRVEPLAKTAMTELLLDDMQDLIDGTASTFYPCKDMKTVFSHCYKVAIRRDLLQYNKALYIELPELHEGERQPFTRQDVAAFLADWQAGNRFAGYPLIMCHCGMRPIELIRQELSQINLQEQHMIGGAKTDAGRDRIIPINDTVFPVIEYFVRTNKKKLLEMSRDKFYVKFGDLIERLGVSNLTPYSCRHFFMTEMARAGIQEGIITAVGGHEDYDTTLRYTHIPTADLVAAANTMAENVKTEK